MFYLKESLPSPMSIEYVLVISRYHWKSPMVFLRERACLFRCPYPKHPRRIHSKRFHKLSGEMIRLHIMTKEAISYSWINCELECDFHILDFLQRRNSIVRLCNLHNHKINISSGAISLHCVNQPLLFMSYNHGSHHF